MTTMLGDMLVRYRADISDLTTKVSQVKSTMSTVTPTAEKTGTSFLSGFKNAASGALQFGAQLGQTVIGVKGMAQAAIGLGSALISPNASMEQTTVGFETLLGKGQKTQAFLKQLQQFAAATPFTFPELAVDAQHMLAFGFNAKDVIPTLTNIGDALGAMGKSSADIDHIVTVFGQMHAAGKLNAGDMMQITSEGIPAWKFLADSMHKTVPEVQSLTTRGLIPADSAIKAVSEGMHKMFGGGMAAQANTFNGLLSTLQDNAGAALRAFTGPLFAAAKQGLTILGNLVSSPQFQSFATGAGQAVANVFGKIGSVIGSIVAPALRNIGPLFQNITKYLNSEAFAGVVADFQTLGNQLGNILGPALQQIVPLIGNLVSGAFAQLGPLLTGTIIPAVDTLVFGLGNFLLWMQQAGPWQEVIRAGLIGIGVAFAAIKIGFFISTIPALVAGFAAWAIGAGAAAVATIAATWPLFAIGAAIAVVVAIIVLAVTHWGQIVTWLKGVWSGLTSFFGNLFSAIGTFFHNFWTGIQSFLQAAWNFIVNVVKVGAALVLAAILGPFIAIGALFVWLYQHNTYFKQLIDAIVGFVRAGVAWLQNAWTTVTTFIVNLWLRLTAYARVYWDLLVFIIQSKITLAKAWLTNVWNQVVSFLQGIWNTITTAVGTMWGKISSFFSSAWNTYIVGPLKGLWASIVSFVSGWPAQAVQWGINLIQGFINGIGSMIGNVIGAVGNIMSNVASHLGFHSPTKEGPGRELDVWGPNMVKGFARGIDKAAPVLNASLNALVRPMASYPIVPSAVAVHSATSRSSRGEQTFVLEVNGQQLAQIVNTSTDRMVRLKLGSNGRAA